MAFSDTRSNRIDPAMLDTCHPDHRARYEFAAAQVSGKVLDAGCGFGYGSAMLAANATFVVGIDLHEEGIGYARKHYQRVGMPAVRFQVAEVATAHLAEAPFDAVVCMEVIEHVEDGAAFVQAARRLLKPGGKFVVSSPNQLVTARGHTPEEFRALLLGFENVDLYGLHLGEAARGYRLRDRTKARIIRAVTRPAEVRIDRHVATAHDQIAVAW